MRIKRIVPLLIASAMLLQNTIVFADQNTSNNTITTTPPVVTPTDTITKLHEVAAGSIMIGGKVYDLEYANDAKNLSNISTEVVSGGAIYVKDFSGNWIDNTTGKIVDSIIIPVKEESSITATVKATSFGASVTATSTQTGATQYQVFNGASKLSAIANIGTATTIFPAKVVGDKVTIKLFNAAGTVVETNDVVLTDSHPNILYPIVTSVSAITITKNVGETYTLPATVTATLSDGITKDLAVTWDKVADTKVAGTYTFTGTLIMADGVVNSNNVSVTAALTVTSTISDNKDISEISVTPKVNKIQFASTISKVGISTATFRYKLLDKNGTDITKTIPASEITAVVSVSSSIVLDQLTGIGTITFNSSSDADKLYIVTLVDNITGIVAMKDSKDLEVINNSDTKDSGIINNNDTEDLHVIYTDTGKLTKIGSNMATFKYTILNKSDIDITKTIPASRIDATASVSSTIALDPSTKTGTITYNSSTDIDKEITITLVDKITGSTLIAWMSTSAIVPSEPATKGIKVSKITIPQTSLSVTPNGYGYATYSICDEYGVDITSSLLSNTVTFKCEVGTIFAKGGLLSLTPNKDISFSTLNSVTITGSDSITGVSTSTTLIVNIIK